MKPKDRDDTAKLAYAFAQYLSKQEAKEAVAAMFDVTQDMAWALIVRGKMLAAMERAA